MRTLIYKRTHKGDPDANGQFGIEDCMGRIRKCQFDVVVGIGGISSEPQSQGISGKLNWIGIGARKHPLSGGRGPLVTFDKFVLFEESGVDFWAIAPILARRLYSRNAPRFIFDDSISFGEKTELARILKMARTAPPSKRTRLPRIVCCTPRRCH